MFIGDDKILLPYVGGVLFFGKSAAKLEAKIKAIQASSLKLTIEDDVYVFLGVEVHNIANGEIELKQSGLIAKVLSTCAMTNCNTKATPCNQDPLKTDPDIDPVTRKFDYALAVCCLCTSARTRAPTFNLRCMSAQGSRTFPRKP